MRDNRHERRLQEHNRRLDTACTLQGKDGLLSWKDSQTVQVQEERSGT